MNLLNTKATQKGVTMIPFNLEYKRIGNAKVCPI